MNLVALALAGLVNYSIRKLDFENLFEFSSASELQLPESIHATLQRPPRLRTFIEVSEIKFRDWAVYLSTSVLFYLPCLSLYCEAGDDVSSYEAQYLHGLAFFTMVVKGRSLFVTSYLILYTVHYIKLNCTLTHHNAIEIKVKAWITLSDRAVEAKKGLRCAS